MTLPSPDSGSFPKVLTLYLELSQYPILAPGMRAAMRQVLFERGVITQEAFEAEVQQKARQSQRREGLFDPMRDEAGETWQTRLGIVRDNLTDFYFAYNLPHELFEELVRTVLTERVPSQDVVLTFHPELAPWDMLFTQGETYEKLPLDQRKRVEHDLEEIKVVLIKAMISDHLEYLAIAKEWFDVATLKEIRDNRLGRGKIGGKAAGIKLAETVLRGSASKELLEHLSFPKSWYIGADVFYQFTQLNGLVVYANQKYKSREEIQRDYPTIRDRFKQGSFPDEIVDGLQSILDKAAGSPLIVRSSSLLEDSFGTSFAGKYESHFCPNQASPEKNLADLQSAISKVYASVYSSDVLLYRRRMGLIDYDERMAILIQPVIGGRLGDYYLPDGAGVAFSRNQFRWSPKIERDAGFLRLVWGLGTRAVETLAGDYPRLVALSHPELRPESDPADIRRYSQTKVDLIDLEANAFKTLPVGSVLLSGFKHLRSITQHFHQGALQDFISRPLRLDPAEIVITFDDLLRRSPLTKLMRSMLNALETAYQVPVDTEFAIMLDEGGRRSTRVSISLLQCRPQSRLDPQRVRLPKDVPADQQLFMVGRVVPEGRVSNIRYVVFIEPKAYADLPVGTKRKELAQVIGRINARLETEPFILIGPGRWGSANAELGVPVGYADIYNARALVEVFEGRSAPEPSYGTHFFQDLVEAHIYPLALGGKGDTFNRSLLEKAPNALPSLLPGDAQWADVVRIVDVAAARGGRRLELVMDGEADKALAYFPAPAAES